MAGLDIKIENDAGEAVDDVIKKATFLTGEDFLMEITFGVFVCNTVNPTCLVSGSMPPVEVFVDFGDGSGIAHWTRENAQDTWRHKYSKAGIYNIFVQGIMI
jgi:hypothetical protein